jgi:hypothetical protein
MARGYPTSVYYDCNIRSLSNGSEGGDGGTHLLDSRQSPPLLDFQGQSPSLEPDPTRPYLERSRSRFDLLALLEPVASLVPERDEKRPKLVDREAEARGEPLDKG